FIGVLPSGYLHHFMVTIDFNHSKLRLDPKKDDDLREPSTLYTLGIALEATTTTPVHVAAVLPGSSPPDDGIQAGDDIVSIGGVAVASSNPYNWSFGLSSATNGATINVDIKRADATTTHALVTRDLLTSPQLN